MTLPLLFVDRAYRRYSDPKSTMSTRKKGEASPLSGANQAAAYRSAFRVKSAQAVAVGGPSWPVQLPMKRNPPGPVLTSATSCTSLPSDESPYAPPLFALSVHTYPPNPNLNPNSHSPSIDHRSIINRSALLPPFISPFLPLAAFLVQVVSSVSEASAARAKPHPDRARDDQGLPLVCFR